MGLLGILFGAYGETQRAKAKAKRFNERWHKLRNVQNLLVHDYIDPIHAQSYRLTVAEQKAMNKYVAQMNEWVSIISSNSNKSDLRHLSQYSTAIKKAAIKSMKLCAKYKIYSNIESVDYDADRKVILLNGSERYSLK